jgi:hypothetical protein
VVEVPGGTLGGTVSTFDATVWMSMTGQGDVLNGFSRLIPIPVTGEIHWSARTPNLANQVVLGEVIEITGSILGDPDFDSLSYSAGSNVGHPVSGTTELNRANGMGAPFFVDGYLDGNHTVEFVGAAGSLLEGMSGGTGDFKRLAICPGGPIPVEETTWGGVKALYE